MAQVSPAIGLAMTAGQHAELEVLERLERGLSDAYTLFHGVALGVGAPGAARRGELDIVVVSASGDLLLLEVKAGPVEVRDDGIFKRYRQVEKDAAGQVRWQYGALRSRLQEERLDVRLQTLLVLPHVRVEHGTAQWPLAQIVDSEGVDRLVTRVQEALPAGTPRPEVRARVVAFLEDRFEVVPDVATLSGRLDRAATRLSAGLATWVPRIEAPTGLIRVVGTAGSGKTQLALRLLMDAASARQRAGYVCFNRPLADHIARIAPVQCRVETFHELAVRLAKRAGKPVQFTSAGAFETLASDGVRALLDVECDLDVLVVDEVQDLQPEWVEALLARVAPGGRTVLLEDPSQRLYADRPDFDIPDAVTVRSDENFRSPRALVQLVNLLALCERPVQALCAHEGELPEPAVYDATHAGAAVRATEAAVRRCLERGFGLSDIAVVSACGRERSSLQRLDRLGGWSLRRFLGRYDEDGGAVWSDGELLVESVRRFKGQSAPAVVLTECDLEALGPMEKRLLFVGITRARMHLEWVVSSRTERALAAALGREGRA